METGQPTGSPGVTNAATPYDLRGRIVSALLATAAAGLLSGALLLLARHHLVFLTLPNQELPLVLGLLVLGAASAQLVPRPHHLLALSVISVVCAVAVAGAWAGVLFAYVACVVAIARSGWRLRSQLGLTLLLWVAFPLARWALFDFAQKRAAFVLAVQWAGLLMSTAFLLVERQRRPDALPTIGQDLFYLVALPRLAVPFFQPVAHSQVLSSERPRMTAAEAATATGLGLLGLLYAVAGGWTRSHSAQLLALPTVPRYLAGYAAYYGRAAGTIFIAMALMRTLGFSMRPGFDRPLLSTSFADFFRRWNHYVRDAVLSLFFFPMVGALRRHLSPRAAVIVSGYIAIFLGAFVLNDVLVPAVTSDRPWKSVLHSLEPARLAVLFVFWSAIIMPQVFRRNPRPTPRGWLARATAVVAFLVPYAALVIAAHRYGKPL